MAINNLIIECNYIYQRMNKEKGIKLIKSVVTGTAKSQNEVCEKAYSLLSEYMRMNGLYKLPVHDDNILNVINDKRV